MKDLKIGVIGLGYVGLPLARLFATQFPVIGFDINEARINELMNGHDATLEVESQDLKRVLVSAIPSTQEKGLYCSSRLQDLKGCNIYIITVPTPVNRYNHPDFSPLIGASSSVGKVLSKGDIVIYESTVYPGATEEICIPVLEKESGFVFNQDFFAGYSPERINPGDKLHTVDKIKKITSGSTPEAAVIINNLYLSVISAGTHLASSIKIAEAAKVIENSQRDINIAFVNELSKICNLLQISTTEVLEAAGTKWNFLPFKPGLVGGHCIGVDPYYLAQKAQEMGYHPEIILAGRRLNDSMGEYVGSEVLKGMIDRNTKIKGSKVLIFGITFKENCPDIRNSKVIDLIHYLQEYGIHTDIFDPHASKEEVKQEYNLTIKCSEKELEPATYDAAVLAVSHQSFSQIPIRKYLKENCFLYDLKGFLKEADGRL